MKRIILTLLVGGAVFGTVLGLAAALTVTGGGAQSGETSAVCDSDGVNVTYQDTNSNGNFEQATVTDIDCSGTLNVRVEGHDVNHNVMASGTNAAGGSGTTLVTLTDQLTSAEVAGVDHTQVNIVQTGP